MSRRRGSVDPTDTDYTGVVVELCVTGKWVSWVTRDTTDLREPQRSKYGECHVYRL